MTRIIFWLVFQMQTSIRNKHTCLLLALRTKPFFKHACQSLWQDDTGTHKHAKMTKRIFALNPILQTRIHDRLCARMESVHAFFLSVIRFLFHDLFWQFYLAAPNVFGGLGGKLPSDVCAEMTLIPAFHWQANSLECIDLIHRKFESLWVIFATFSCLYVYKIVFDLCTKLLFGCRPKQIIIVPANQSFTYEQ